MTLPILGIDIAKKSYQVTLLLAGKRYHRTFRNERSDFAALVKWLGKHRVSQTHACMEATGQFWEAVAEFLHQHGHRVSVVNPARIRNYARSQLRRNKTDKLDGDVIADFCAAQQPACWTPLPPERQELRARVRYLEDLQGMRTQEVNRLQSGTENPPVVARLAAHVAYLEAEIAALQQEIQELIDQHAELAYQRSLLVSIPGIGVLTAAKLLSESIHTFASAKALTAYAGLNPQLRQSGSSLWAKPQLSKVGNAGLRKALYFPAMSARRTNPLVRAFCDRLCARGKVKKAVLGAAMRKLLCLAYGVLKSGQPFDPHFVEKVRIMA